MILNRTDGSFKSYLSQIKSLEGKIEWVPNETTGTGKAFQNKIFNQIEKIITEHNNTYKQ